MNEPQSNVENPQEAGCLPRPCSAANAPAARAIDPKMWAEFCDWWTGWQGKAKFQNLDEAWFLFTIGHQTGHDRAIPLQLVCERILNWWRCDGGIDTLGTIMDDLEGVLESRQNLKVSHEAGK